MDTTKNSRYSYSQSEKETLKVLKMQQQDLASLERDTTSQTGELDDIRNRLEKLSARLGVSPNPAKKVEKSGDCTMKISSSEIPTWESLTERAATEVTEDVVLEDFLSKEEFNYCIEDIERINKEFSEKTSIWNKRDLSFLALPTGLQTARWIIVQYLINDQGAEEKTVDSAENSGISPGEGNDGHEEHGEEYNARSKKGYPTCEEIIFGRYPSKLGGKTRGACPYNAFGGQLGPKEKAWENRRKNTLGHDPLLGWIFGTANLMTCSISCSRIHHFLNYKVVYPMGIIGQPYTPVRMFNDVFESIREDKYRLAAGLFAQGVQLSSSQHRQKGLPIPQLQFFSTELAGKLYSEQYDRLCLIKDMSIIGLQASLSVLINMIIGFVHKMLYDKEKDGPDQNQYEVRTRKILLISNLLASGGNALYCAFSEDWKKLDTGGILVSLYRLFSDGRFITKVKDQFIRQQLDQAISKEIRDIEANFTD